MIQWFIFFALNVTMLAYTLLLSLAAAPAAVSSKPTILNREGGSGVQYGEHLGSLDRGIWFSSRSARSESGWRSTYVLVFIGSRVASS